MTAIPTSKNNSISLADAYEAAKYRASVRAAAEEAQATGTPPGDVQMPQKPDNITLEQLDEYEEAYHQYQHDIMLKALAANYDNNPERMPEQDIEATQTLDAYAEARGMTFEDASKALSVDHDVQEGKKNKERAEAALAATPPAASGGDEDEPLEVPEPKDKELIAKSGESHDC